MSIFLHTSATYLPHSSCSTHISRFLQSFPFTFHPTTPHHPIIPVSLLSVDLQKRKSSSLLDARIAKIYRRHRHSRDDDDSASDDDDDGLLACDALCIKVLADKTYASNPSLFQLLKLLEQYRCGPLVWGHLIQMIDSNLAKLGCQAS